MAKRGAVDQRQGAAGSDDNKKRFENSVTALIHKHGDLVSARYRDSHRIDRI